MQPGFQLGLKKLLQNAHEKQELIFSKKYAERSYAQIGTISFVAKPLKKIKAKNRAKDRRSARQIAGLLAGRRFIERFRIKADIMQKKANFEYKKTQINHICASFNITYYLP